MDLRDDSKFTHVSVRGRPRHEQRQDRQKRFFQGTAFL